MSQMLILVLVSVFIVYILQIQKFFEFVGVPSIEILWWQMLYVNN